MKLCRKIRICTKIGVGFSDEKAPLYSGAFELLGITNLVVEFFCQLKQFGILFGIFRFNVANLTMKVGFVHGGLFMCAHITHITQLKPRIICGIKFHIILYTLDGGGGYP